MPNYTQRPVNTFVRGLITEAGELTFPENASTAENNCELFRDGSRRRRKAIALEPSATNSSFSVTSSTLIHFGEWKNVGNNADKQYLVVQVGPSLHFYDKSVVPYSSSEKSFVVDLTQFEVTSAGSAGTAKCDFTPILGNLVVVSRNIEPFYITVNEEDEFAAVKINCRIRDFKWLGDKSTYDTKEASPNERRQYDTKNCGWVGEKGNAALTTFISSEGGWPPLTHPWYSGKNSSGDFSVAEWKKVYSGNSLIGNGHYVLDLFDKKRTVTSGVTNLGTSISNFIGDLFEGALSEVGSTTSGVTLIDVESGVEEPTRFTTVVSFSSRVFFSGLSSSESTGKVYFSQILQDMTNVGDFFQNNDPTAEDISDLLETDGGVIVIPDATEIKKLYAFQNSIFVFADNGVWQIQGVDGVFSPTAYSVGKITDMGIVSRGSFTAAEGVPFWWSKHGIHTLAFNEYGRASEQNLSVTTIQKFWNDIEGSAKTKVQAVYDKINKKIFWLYPSNNESVNNKYSEVLILDVPLQAFYPWSFGSDNSSAYILGFQFYEGFGTSEVEFDVINGDDDVVAGVDDVVSTQLSPLATSPTSVVYFVRVTSSDKMTMALVNSNTYHDWGTTSYLSFAETGYDFVEDLILKKTAPYIVTYLRETETGISGNEDDGYTPINESSLLLSAYWDFKKTQSSAPQQVYRRSHMYLVDPSSLTFTSKESVVSSRIKVRGRGRSLRIRLESEEGKDFIFLGHGLIADVAGKF